MTIRQVARVLMYLLGIAFALGVFTLAIEMVVEADRQECGFDGQRCRR